MWCWDKNFSFAANIFYQMERKKRIGLESKFAGNDNLRKSTKIARQVVNLPGDDLKRFVVFLHGIVHTHSRNIPVAGQGFFLAVEVD